MAEQQYTTVYKPMRFGHFLCRTGKQNKSKSSHWHYWYEHVIAQLGPSIRSEPDPSYNRTALGHHPTVTQHLSFLRQRNQFPLFLLMFDIPEKVWIINQHFQTFFGEVLQSLQVVNWHTHRCKVVAKSNEDYMGTEQLEGPTLYTHQEVHFGK